MIREPDTREFHGALKTPGHAMADQTASQRPKSTHKRPPVRISRAFSVPRPMLFTAWSSADRVKRWFSPGTYAVSDAKVHMYVGGPFDVRLRSPYGGERLIRGVFVEVVPHERLVIEMAVADSEGRRLFKAFTEVTFAEDIAGVRMEVVQNFDLIDPATAAPMVWGALEGWRTTLDRLEEEVTRMGRIVTHATLHLERIFDAPVARVWEAITEERAKSEWLDGPLAEGELLEHHVDVGGRERLRVRRKEGEIATFDVAYYDVIPNERLVYAFERRLGDAKASVSLATIQLEADGARTRFMITEQGAFLDGHDDAASREHGLGRLLDALGAALKD